MGALDGFVDGEGKAEIVGGNKDPLPKMGEAAGSGRLAPSCAVRRGAYAACRSRRNWKNSTPSRSRRFIICGLRTISPTMEAIFGARK